MRLVISSLLVDCHVPRPKIGNLLPSERVTSGARVTEVAIVSKLSVSKKLWVL